MHPAPPSHCLPCPPASPAKGPPLPCPDLKGAGGTGLPLALPPPLSPAPAALPPALAAPTDSGRGDAEAWDSTAPLRSVDVWLPWPSLLRLPPPPTPSRMATGPPLLLPPRGRLAAASRDSKQAWRRSWPSLRLLLLPHRKCIALAGGQVERPVGLTGRWRGLEGGGSGRVAPAPNWIQDPGLPTASQCALPEGVLASGRPCGHGGGGGRVSSRVSCICPSQNMSAYLIKKKCAHVGSP